MDENQEEFKNMIKGELINESTNVTFIGVEHEEKDVEKISSHVSDSAIPLIIDLTWIGNIVAQKIANQANIYYLRIDISISAFLNFLDIYMEKRISNDITVVFDDDSYIDQAIHISLNSPKLRLFLTTKEGKLFLDKNSTKINPMPGITAFISSTTNMIKTMTFVIQHNIIKIPDRIIILFSDVNYDKFNFKVLGNNSINIFKIRPDICCLLQDQTYCVCSENFNIYIEFLRRSFRKIVDVFKNNQWGDHRSSSSYKNYIYQNSSNSDGYVLKMKMKNDILQVFSNGLYFFENETNTLKIKLSGTIEKYYENGSLEVKASYEDEDIVPHLQSVINPIKNFYRIGVTKDIPWTYEEINSTTGETYLTGYCIDFIKKLSEIMNFDYELVEPKNGTYGNKNKDGEWDGLVGGLVRGEIDIAVTDLIMTADKEEVVDFVAPYFEEAGISIVMRKPVRKTSLFKFMTVLKLEVWLSILAALTITAVMIWFLDKYSPYSAKNNKQLYNYPCRNFTLKESFWFALTSFTPQGGGEAPKSLSGRTLVAAYWLFVVLMLATFTANLAAFLTVERMQTPVQSLEQLARQSRINYTVVNNSQTHKYFINMKYAEDTLYRMWKELTLNSSPDDSRYRVWDYPIKEQYGHILIAITDSEPLATLEEGFQKVNERTDVDFALIHDSSQIKYEITKNCNLTEVGEVFAIKPYAVAVQQGSHLQDELSMAILDLQRSRYLEYLKTKYWNNSLQDNCPDTNDGEGITLQSLGGVFIATLFGLALAMVTLVFEVMYYKLKRKKSQIHPNKNKPMKKKGNVKTITIGNTLELLPDRNLTPQISVYPRNRFTKFEHWNI